MMDSATVLKRGILIPVGLYVSLLREVKEEELNF
jgi:hypothetical protein